MFRRIQEFRNLKVCEQSFVFQYGNFTEQKQNTGQRRAGKYFEKSFWFEHFLQCLTSLFSSLSFWKTFVWTAAPFGEINKEFFILIFRLEELQNRTKTSEELYQDLISDLKMQLDEVKRLLFYTLF